LDRKVLRFRVLLESVEIIGQVVKKEPTVRDTTIRLALKEMR
jgi:hypothetical protein